MREYFKSVLFFNDLFPTAPYSCEASSVICGFISMPLYGDFFFFCFQGLTFKSRADGTLLIYVVSTAPGNCSWHTCPAVVLGVPSHRSQCFRQINLGAIRQLCEMIVLQGLIQWSNVLETGAACFPGKTVCLVTMSFCLLELREDFLLWLGCTGKAEMWWSEKCVFLDLCATKHKVSFVAYIFSVPPDLSWTAL